ncbi:TPA: hypothetical protein ACMD15_003432 [Vibrio cholerae]
MWSSSSGWQPVSIDQAINSYYEAFKMNGYRDLSYSQFVDSREYEVSYMGAQIDHQISSMFGEVIQRLKVFIRDTNEKIMNPTTTANAIMSGINDTFGFRCSVKEMTAEDAGKIHIAIDHGDISKKPELRYEIARFLEKQCVVGGIVTVGDIEQTIVLGSGGVEIYRWTANKDTLINWRVKITISRNSTSPLDTVEEVIKKFFDNWKNLYWIGMDVEPESYLNIFRDCPYASSILLEYSVDGGESWSNEVIKSKYDVKYIPEFSVKDVEFF